MATRNDTTVSTKEALAAWDSVYNAREELNGLIDAFPDFNLHEPEGRVSADTVSDLKTAVALLQEVNTRLDVAGDREAPEGERLRHKLPEPDELGAGNGACADEATGRSVTDLIKALFRGFQMETESLTVEECVRELRTHHINVIDNLSADPRFEDRYTTTHDWTEKGLRYAVALACLEGEAYIEID